MATIAWHPALPQRPLIGGYQETLPDVLVRSQTDAGPAKVRRRTTDGVTDTGWRFRMSTAQLAIFRSYFATDLAHGALPFTLSHPITGAIKQFRLTKPPQITPAGAQYFVDLKVEQLP